MFYIPTQFSEIYNSSTNIYPSESIKKCIKRLNNIYKKNDRMARNSPNIIIIKKNIVKLVHTASIYQETNSYV